VFARACLFAALLTVGTCFAAGPPPRSAGPTAAQLARWIKQLGDDDFGVRERATARLRAAGPAAEAALEKAAGSGDAEVARRAGEILRDFRWGIYPDTPPKVVALVQSYQTASRSEKGAILRKLLAAGPAGCRTLPRIALAEKDALVRKEVFGRIARDLAPELPALLEARNFDALDGLLELALAGETRTAFADYAAYWLLRGKLPARIVYQEALASRHPTGKPQAEVLTYLYRAKGDLTAARKAAETAERPDLVEALLLEAGDWKELARKPELIGSTNPLEQLALKVTYNRLAGNDKGFEEALAALRKWAASAGPKAEPFALAKVFFLNDRPAEALKVLAGARERLRFEVLAARYDIRAARALVEQARKAKSKALPALEILEARTRYALGEKDAAVATFKRYGGLIKAGTDASWFEDLIDAENRAGLRELALEHAARVLSVSKDYGWPGRLFGKLFGDRARQAEVLWFLLRTQKSAPGPDKVLAQVQALLEGKASAREVNALVETTKESREADKLPAGVWLALAEAALACKQEAQAQACLKKADTPEAHLRLGDLFARNKKWSRAAGRYALAYQRCTKAPLRVRDEEDEEECTPALALYLSGRALVRAGKADEGKQRMEQAHWLPLGDGRARYLFARALVKRGHLDEARREYDLLRRVGEPALHEADSFYTGEALRAGAIDALERKEYLRAALGYEQSMLRVLRPLVNFVQPSAYAGVPGMVHRLRARGLLGAGKVEEALREAALSQAVLPGNIDLAIALVPELERRGRKKEAAKLFAQARALFDELGRDYPKAAWVHNSLAWLSACCRRDLEDGLAHAREAVKLSPKSAAYHDTLAEVYFQLGKKDLALSHQKKAIALDPKKVYFRKQLKRIEAGNPAAPRPPEEDEE
jgi:Flp pilus assembly protein TadD